MSYTNWWENMGTISTRNSVSERLSKGRRKAILDRYAEERDSLLGSIQALSARLARMGVPDEQVKKAVDIGANEAKKRAT